MRILAAVLLAWATTLASWAHAQDFPIRVGRIAHIEGRASLFRDADAGWEKAYVNSPVTSENSVWTDEGARAEVRVSGMAIRLDHLTQLDVARLDEDELDAFVARGSVALRVRHFENNERLAFSTPNARVRLRENGRYRIDVDPERLETRITVFSGEAGVGAEDGRVRVAAGRSVVVFGADPPEFVEERVLTSAFDRWTLARDERWREGRAPTYVSTYMTGYEDLDAYGQWVTEPDYGVLWYPRQVAADWAPYRYGHWDYVRPWGWTWVDDAPWGYAPSHYGRWVYVRNRWGWLPGERVARPVWAPALVAWVGGSGWSVGVSSGGPSLGWYPLSPWDRYDPWFQASPTYVQRVNVVVRPEPARADRRQWRQWTRERGMTVVDRRALVERQPVHRSLRRVSDEVIRQAQAAPRPEAVLPTRDDVVQRRRERPQQGVPAPRVVVQAPEQAGASPQTRRSEVARPNFGRNAVVATPREATAQERQARRQEQAQRQAERRGQREGQQAQRNAEERAQREQRQAQERQAREQQQAQRQAEERAQREQRQAQERQAREQQQAQKQAEERAQREQRQAQRNAEERAQREQRQAQERQAREQQQAQKQAEERAQREQRQAQERQAREQQQAQKQAEERAQREQRQAQRNAEERAQREQRQTQERQAREQQQAQKQAEERAQREQRQAQRNAEERAQREQRQAQERQAREQQQAQKQAEERAQREQRQAQERQAREQQQAQKQAEERAQREQRQAQAQQQQPGRGRGPQRDEDDEERKGRSR
jgi:hypothetical protein